MVYTDGTHIIASELGELHAFAQSIGMKHEWFQDHPRHPHYDTISKRTKTAALRKGAVMKSSKDLVNILNNQAKKDDHDRI